MALVEMVLGVVRTAVFTLSQLYGGNLGAAILTVPVLVRLALLPVNVRLALAHRRRAETLARIRPQLERLRKRFRDRPERLANEMQALFRENGLNLLDLRALVGPAAQWPIWGALYLAVQQVSRSGGAFLWMADLARPDRLLAVVAAGLTLLGVTTGASPDQPAHLALALVISLVALLFVARAAAGVGLYWAGSAAVSLLQNLLVRRLAARPS